MKRFSLGVAGFDHPQAGAQGRYVEAAAKALQLFLGDRYASNFAVRFWDGTVHAAQIEPRFTLCVNSPGALRAAFRPPFDLHLGRAFVAGALECEGDLEAMFDAFYQASHQLSRTSMLKIVGQMRRLPRGSVPHGREARLRGRLHSLERDRTAIGFHYDQPIGFYRAFLDAQLYYSCAYFDDGVSSLAEAQQAKADYTLRKLRLRPGETLLDIGCGWGALVIHAAQHFGAKALGITLSRAQHDEAERRISELGLSERAAVELRDYRELRGRVFDKIVSVGMFEHVGRGRLAEYFSAVLRALKAGGLFLNHGICEEGPRRKAAPSTGFMGRFIFPDGELVPISDALGFAERAGFEVRDVENLREHYTRTLREWVKNLERNRDAAVRQAGEQAYRAWRLYMAGSAQGFRIGRIGVVQSLLAKPDANGGVGIPATRRDLYA